MFKRKHLLMDEAGGEPAPGGAPAPAPIPEPAAAPAPAPAPAPASLLEAGAAPVEPGATDYIPEKYRVTKEDGSLDSDASSRKLADAYSALEKKLGTGDARPAAAADYKVAVPDAFKDVIDPAADPGIKGFLDGAHAVGLNQAQVDFVMDQYFDMAPKLVAGAAVLDKDGATAELKKVWATEADLTRNVQSAYVAANAAGQKAGIDINEIMSGPLGNNPQFLRLMAALGNEFKEDVAPGARSMVSADDISTLMTSEAYTNPRHAEHAKVSAQVKTYFDRKHGTDPV